ncbi:hypothetical protein KIH39_19145 [Telmatocola sphagniphila]|uniref:Uncharacterized protein n=1 Tax=Telmatocola sphagniphila TaxID=1123043 RepID=A0A8E6B4G3_9BACT|nr:hypothetical protein [Telmatocola sphagniphila]QVL30951.1 hypothetical protein KIH39_19145 [Telmatocola sphagniphila]
MSLSSDAPAESSQDTQLLESLYEISRDNGQITFLPLPAARKMFRIIQYITLGFLIVTLGCLVAYQLTGIVLFAVTAGMFGFFGVSLFWVSLQGSRNAHKPLILDSDGSIYFGSKLWVAARECRAIRFWMSEQSGEAGTHLVPNLKLELVENRFKELPWPCFVSTNSEHCRVLAERLSRELKVPVSHIAAPAVQSRKSRRWTVFILLLIGVPHFLIGLFTVLNQGQGWEFGLLFIGSGMFLLYLANFLIRKKRKSDEETFQHPSNTY